MAWIFSLKDDRESPSGVTPGDTRSLSNLAAVGVLKPVTALQLAGAALGSEVAGISDLTSGVTSKKKYSPITK